ncbi:MAG: ribulose-phosphate 3-epimerase [Deltaproteobacteria bacterium]
MKEIKIAPSILSANFAELGDEVKKVEDAGADMLHIDVMDGHFVPNITIGIPVVASIKKITGLPLDVHLMIENPERYIEAFAKAGADIITFHIEAAKHAHRLVQQIKGLGLKAGVSLNPATHISSIEHIRDDIDMILVMTVNPGFGGQEFIEAMLPKISSLSGGKAEIQVDGGIGAQNISKVVSAGAKVIVAGTSVFGNPSPADAVKDLRRRAYEDSNR